VSRTLAFKSCLLLLDVFEVESAPRGRGNGGAAPLQKGKWRWNGSGRGGGTQCDDSRPDGRWLCGIGPKEGDEGRADQVGSRSEMENKNENGVGLGCEGHLGQIQIGPLRKIENCFSNFCFKEMGFKSKVLNISKPNLNYIENRIKSNQLFGPFSNMEIDLNNQI
jgi:hypothetical protein